MPYLYTAFGTVSLPVYNHEQDHATGDVDSTLVTTPNAAYDYLGTSRRLSKRQVIGVKGIYHDELDYLVDQAGNYILDQAGNYIVVGASGDTLRNQLDNLKAKLGKSDQLWRTDYSGGLRRWKQARLLKVEHPTTVNNRAVFANIGATFETNQAAWRNETSTTITQSLSSGSNTVTTNILGTEDVNDAVITITATGTITSVHITLVATGVDFTWTGSLTSGQILAIDCGKLTIKKNGADAYSGFTLASGHTAQGWVTLAAQAANALGINVNAAGSVSVVRYDQWT